ncbi:MAG: DUF434 domain-containing protein [Bacteroidota bacterium]
MASKQKHRGPHSNDPLLFNEKGVKKLNLGVRDLSWLLTRGYAEKSALGIVGDRYRLNVRQRKALWRAVCSDQAEATRKSKLVNESAITGEPIVIDGYNLLITIESALAGGVVLACKDGTYRDIASIHGTYRRVEETLPALSMIGVHLQELQVAHVCWLLDRPVSNSGRLKVMMLEIAEQYGFDWSVELLNNPDKGLVLREDAIAVSSDGWVLDRVKRWYNLHQDLLKKLPSVNLIKLDGSDNLEA